MSDEVQYKPYYASLYLQATFWRLLARMAMEIGWLFDQGVLKPKFTKSIPSVTSSSAGRIKLYFYTPSDYCLNNPTKRYPLVVNFHGGGFVIGNATDDARWSSAVATQLGAVVCSVAYRMGPECPFPTSVQDAADAICWLYEHSEELRLDRDRIALSGFSAGANLAITAPLYLRNRPSTDKPPTSELPADVIKAIVPWYPVVDYVTTAEEKRRDPAARSIPANLLRLFHYSFTLPAETQWRSPFLSPGLADDAVLRTLPHNVFLYLCEKDELREEGERFGARLTGLGFNIKSRLIEGAPHGFDKYPGKMHPLAKESYDDAIEKLKQVLFGD